MNDETQTVALRIAGELMLDCESLLAILRSEKSDVMPAHIPATVQKGTTRLARTLRGWRANEAWQSYCFRARWRMITLAVNNAVRYSSVK